MTERSSARFYQKPGSRTREIEGLDSCCNLSLKLMGRFVQQPISRVSSYSLATASALQIDLLNLGRFEAELGLFSPSDVDIAQQVFKANCGPAAFGAIFRHPVRRVMSFFPQFPKRDWTTIGDMKRALQAIDANFKPLDYGLPSYGLALLQLRIDDRRLHPLYSLAHTHWVGVCMGCFYDVNWRGWLPIPLWERLVLPQLRFGTQRARRWEVRNSLEVLNQEFVQPALGFAQTGPNQRTISALRVI